MKTSVDILTRWIVENISHDEALRLIKAANEKVDFLSKGTTRLACLEATLEEFALVASEETE